LYTNSTYMNIRPTTYVSSATLNPLSMVLPKIYRTYVIPLDTLLPNMHITYYKSIGEFSNCKTIHTYN